jgi:hypothetical protein
MAIRLIDLMPRARAHREKKTLIHVSALHYLLWFNSTAEQRSTFEKMSNFNENNTSSFPLPLKYNTVSNTSLCLWCSKIILGIPKRQRDKCIGIRDHDHGPNAVPNTRNDPPVVEV